MLLARFWYPFGSMMVYDVSFGSILTPYNRPCAQRPPKNHFDLLISNILFDFELFLNGFTLFLLAMEFFKKRVRKYQEKKLGKYFFTYRL